MERRIWHLPLRVNRRKRRGTTPKENLRSGSARGRIPLLWLRGESLAITGEAVRGKKEEGGSSILSSRPRGNGHYVFYDLRRKSHRGQAVPGSEGGRKKIWIKREPLSIHSRGKRVDNPPSSPHWGGAHFLPGFSQEKREKRCKQGGKSSISSRFTPQKEKEAGVELDVRGGRFGKEKGKLLSLRVLRTLIASSPEKEKGEKNHCSWEKTSPRFEKTRLERI